MRSIWLTFAAVSLALSALAAGPPRQTDSSFVSYQPGDLPLILSVPHGGARRPASIPDRAQAVVVNDWGSRELAFAVAAEIEEISGRRPHLISNQLHRSKLDPNRSLQQGAQGDAIAAATWRGYHDAINRATQAAVDQCGWGVYLDIHSYGDRGRGVQFGYGLTAEQLEQEDADLSDRRFVFASNLRYLALNSDQSLAELVRGATSLGALLDSHGYWAVPSPDHPQPAEGYFDGGYSVYMHGPRRSSGVDAIQLEAPYDLLQPTRRERFVAGLAYSLIKYLETHYHVHSYDPAFCSGFADVSLDHWAAPSISALAAAGRLQPCRTSPRRYCPERALDRGEMAALVWWALEGSEPPPFPAARFADVTGSEHAAEIAALWRRGYLDPCALTPLRYCPDEPLTRADLATIVLRLRDGPGVIPPAPAGVFGPAAADWNLWWIEGASRRDLLPRCPSSLPFGCAARPVSRAEAAWALARAMGAER